MPLSGRIEPADSGSVPLDHLAVLQKNVSTPMRSDIGMKNGSGLWARGTRTRLWQADAVRTRKTGQSLLSLLFPVHTKKVVFFLFND